MPDQEDRLFPTSKSLQGNLKKSVLISRGGLTGAYDVSSIPLEESIKNYMKNIIVQPDTRSQLPIGQYGRIGESQYTKGIPLGLVENVEELRSMKQSNWAKFGNMMARGLAMALIAAPLEPFGYLLDLNESLGMVDKAERDWDNFLNKALRGLEDKLREKLPVYTTEEKPRIFSADWWFSNGDQMIKSMGYLIPGMAFFKAGSLAMKASQISKVVSGLTSPRVGQLTTEFGGALFSSVAQNYSEHMMSATQAFQEQQEKWYNYYSKVNPPEIAMKMAKQKAAEEAAGIVEAGRANILLELPENFLLFRTIKTARSMDKAVGLADRQAMMIDRTQKAARAGMVPLILDRSSGIAMPATSEWLQEVNTGHFENEARRDYQLAKGEIADDGSSSMERWMKHLFTYEGLTEGLSGAIGGGLMGSVMQVVNRGKTVEARKALLDNAARYNDREQYRKLQALDNYSAAFENAARGTMGTWLNMLKTFSDMSNEEAVKYGFVDDEVNIDQFRKQALEFYEDAQYVEEKYNDLSTKHANNMEFAQDLVWTKVMERQAEKEYDKASATANALRAKVVNMFAKPLSEKHNIDSLELAENTAELRSMENYLNKGNQLLRDLAGNNAMEHLETFKDEYSNHRIRIKGEYMPLYEDRRSINNSMTASEIQQRLDEGYKIANELKTKENNILKRVFEGTELTDKQKQARIKSLGLALSDMYQKIQSSEVGKQYFDAESARIDAEQARDVALERYNKMESDPAYYESYRKVKEEKKQEVIRKVEDKKLAEARRNLLDANPRQVRRIVDRFPQLRQEGDARLREIDQQRRVNKIVTPEVKKPEGMEDVAEPDNLVETAAVFRKMKEEITAEVTAEQQQELTDDITDVFGTPKEAKAVELPKIEPEVSGMAVEPEAPAITKRDKMANFLRNSIDIFNTLGVTDAEGQIAFIEKQIGRKLTEEDRSMYTELYEELITGIGTGEELDSGINPEDDGKSDAQQESLTFDEQVARELNNTNYEVESRGAPLAYRHVLGQRKRLEGGGYIYVNEISENNTTLVPTDKTDYRICLADYMQPGTEVVYFVDETNVTYQETKDNFGLVPIAVQTREDFANKVKPMYYIHRMDYYVAHDEGKPMTRELSDGTVVPALRDDNVVKTIDGKPDVAELVRMYSDTMAIRALVEEAYRNRKGDEPVVLTSTISHKGPGFVNAVPGAMFDVTTLGEDNRVFFVLGSRQSKSFYRPADRQEAVIANPTLAKRITNNDIQISGIPFLAVPNANGTHSLWQLYTGSISDLANYIDEHTAGGEARRMSPQAIARIKAYADQRVVAQRRMIDTVATILNKFVHGELKHPQTGNTLLADDVHDVALIKREISKYFWMSEATVGRTAKQQKEKTEKPKGGAQVFELFLNEDNELYLKLGGIKGEPVTLILLTAVNNETNKIEAFHTTSGLETSSIEMLKKAMYGASGEENNRIISTYDSREGLGRQSYWKGTRGLMDKVPNVTQDILAPEDFSAYTLEDDGSLQYRKMNYLEFLSTNKMVWHNVQHIVVNGQRVYTMQPHTEMFVDGRIAKETREKVRGVTVKVEAPETKPTETGIIDASVDELYDTPEVSGLTLAGMDLSKVRISAFYNTGDFINETQIIRDMTVTAGNILGEYSAKGQQLTNQQLMGKLVEALERRHAELTEKGKENASAAMAAEKLRVALDNMDVSYEEDGETTHFFGYKEMIVQQLGILKFKIDSFYETIEEEEGENEKKNNEDSRNFTESTEDSASARVRRMLYSIPMRRRVEFTAPDGTKTVTYKAIPDSIGLPAYHDYNEVFNIVQATLADVPKKKMMQVLSKMANLESNVEGISIPGERNIMLYEVLRKVNSVSRKERNEFLTVMRNQSSNKVVNVVSANSSRHKIDNVSRAGVKEFILSKWYESFKRLATRNNWLHADTTRKVDKETAGLTEDEGAIQFEDSISKQWVNQLGIIKQKGEKAGYKLERPLINELAGMLRVIGIDMDPQAIAVMYNSYMGSEAGGSEATRYNNFMEEYVQVFEILNGAKNQNVTFQEDFEQNNPFVQARQRILRMAWYQSLVHPEIFSSSFRNSGGEVEYGYIKPNHLSDTISRILSDEAYRKELLDDPFIASSTWLKDFDSDVFNMYDNFRLIYFDALKKKGNDTAVRPVEDMSPAERLMNRLDMFHNNNNANFALYFTPTPADKTTNAVIRAPKKLFCKPGDVGNTFRNGRIFINPDTNNAVLALTEVALSELRRINDVVSQIATLSEAELLTGYHTGPAMGRHFILFPFLNPIVNSEMAEHVLRNNLTNESTGEVLYRTGQIEPNDAVKAVIRRSIANELTALIEHNANLLETTGIVDYTTHSCLLDKKMLSFSTNRTEEEMRNMTNQVVAAFTFNNALAYANMFQLVTGDPAVFAKGKKAEPGETTQEKRTRTLKNIDETCNELFKRVAKDIAPGLEPYSFDDPSDSYKTVFGNEEFADSELIAIANKVGGDVRAFKKIQLADAQEWVLVEEHLRLLHTLGRIDEDQVTKLTQKAVDESLSEDELTLLSQPLGPMKPVYVGNEYNPTLRKWVPIYIKTSSFPLIPQIVKNLEMGKVERMMRKEGISRLVLKSGVKTGFRNPVQLFKDGKVDETINMADHAITLSRDNMRIQQEIPYDPEKDESIKGTQMFKLIFSSIPVNTKGIKYKGVDRSSIELKQLHDEIQEMAYRRRWDKLLKKLQASGVNPEDVNLTNVDELHKLLVEEATDRKWGLQEVLMLNILHDSKGSAFEIPLFFHHSADKIEGLLNSIFKNKVLKNRVKGKSYVQGSSLGFFYDKEAIATEEQGKEIYKEGEIVYIDEAHKGSKLGYKYDEETGSVYAEILITPNLHKLDADGRKVQLRASELVKDGYLNTDLVDPALLEGLGYRIPTQGHFSMVRIKIVGFLPTYHGDLVIVPPEIVKQMGSDFDVDKLYTFFNAYTVTEDGRFIKKEPAMPDTNEAKLAKYKSNLRDLDYATWYKLNEGRKDFMSRIRKLKDKYRDDAARVMLDEIEQMEYEKKELMRWDYFDEAELAEEESRIAEVRKTFEDTFGKDYDPEVKLSELREELVTLRSGWKDLSKLIIDQGFKAYQYKAGEAENYWLTDDELDNKTLEIFLSILKSPYVSSNLTMQELSTTTLGKVGNEIDSLEEEARQKMGGERTYYVGNATSSWGLLNTDHHDYVKVNNTSGKNGTAVFAAALTQHAYLQYANVYIKPEVSFSEDANGNLRRNVHVINSVRFKKPSKFGPTGEAVEWSYYNDLPTLDDPANRVAEGKYYLRDIVDNPHYGVTVGAWRLDKIFTFPDEDGNVKAISSVLSSLLSAAVDNAKEQKLQKLGINADTFGVATLIAHAGFDEYYIGLFLKNPAIVEYLRRLSAQRSILNGNFESAWDMQNRIAKELVLELRYGYDKAQRYLEGTLDAEATDKMYGLVDRVEAFSLDEMRDMIRDPEAEHNKRNQAHLLNAFMRYKQMADELLVLQNLTKVDTKFLDKSICASSLTSHKFNGKFNFKDTDHNPEDDERYRLGNINNLVIRQGQMTIPGAAHYYGIMGSLGMYKDANILPFHTKVWQDIVEEIADLLKIGEDISKLRKELVYDINQGIRSSIYSRVYLQMPTLMEDMHSITDDNGRQMFPDPTNVDEVRKALMLDSEDNRSLATFVEEMKQTSSNPMIKYLLTQRGFNGSVSTVEAMSMKEVKELASQSIVSGWQQLLSSTDPKEKGVGVMMVAYALLNGNQRTARDFGRFMPPDYLRSIGYGDKLRAVTFLSREEDGITYYDDPTTQDLARRFVSQWVQHHPFRQLQVDLKQELASGNIQEALTEKGEPMPAGQLPYKIRFKKEAGMAANYFTHIQKTDGKSPVVWLYKRVGEFDYVRIPHLGDHAHTEYNLNREVARSMFHYNPSDIRDYDSGMAGIHLTDPEEVMVTPEYVPPPTPEVVGDGADILGASLGINKLLESIAERGGQEGILAKHYLEKFPTILKLLDFRVISKDDPLYIAEKKRWEVKEDMRDRGGWYYYGSDPKKGITHTLVLVRDIVGSNLDTRTVEGFTSVSIHEVTHAIIGAMFRLNKDGINPFDEKTELGKKLNEELKVNILALKKLLDLCKNNKEFVESLTGQEENMFEDESEFASYVLQYSSIRDKMRVISYKGNKTLLDRFREIISKILQVFGIENQAIAETLATVFRLGEMSEAYLDSWIRQEPVDATHTDLVIEDKDTHYIYGNNNVKPYMQEQLLSELRKLSAKTDQIFQNKRTKIFSVGNEVYDEAQAIVDHINSAYAYNVLELRDYGNGRSYFRFVDNNIMHVNNELDERDLANNDIKGMLLETETSFMSIGDELRKQVLDPSVETMIDRMKQRVALLKRTLVKDPERRSRTEKRIRDLENDIEKLQKGRDDATVLAIGAKQGEQLSRHLDTISRYLNRDDLTNKEMLDIARNLQEMKYYLRVWVEGRGTQFNIIRDLFPGDLDKDMGERVRKIRDMYDYLDGRWRQSTKQLFVKFVNANSRRNDRTMKEMSESVVDENWWSKMMLGMHSSPSDLLRVSDYIVENWLYRIHQDALAMDKEIEQWAQEVRQATGKRGVAAFRSFLQYYENGKWTGNIVHAIKQEYYDEAGNMFERYHNGEVSKEQLHIWFRNNTDEITSKDLEDANNGNFTASKVYTVEEMKEQKRMLDMYEKTYQAYRNSVIESRQYHDAEGNVILGMEKLFNEDMYDWERTNSPYIYLRNTPRVRREFGMKGYNFLLDPKPKLEKWGDPNYQKLIRNPKMKELYDRMMTMFSNNSDLLPLRFQRQVNYLPELYKSFEEEMLESGKLMALKKNVPAWLTSIIAEKIDHQDNRIFLDGEEVKSVKVQMMGGELSAEQKSYDLEAILKKQTRMALAYKFKSEIDPVMQAGWEFLNEIDEHDLNTDETVKTNFLNKKANLGKRLVNTKEHYLRTLDAKLYSAAYKAETWGIKKKIYTKEEKNKLLELDMDLAAGKITDEEFAAEVRKLGMNLTASRVGDSLIQWTYMKALAFPNLISPAVNGMFGIMSNFMYAAGKEDFNEQDSWKAFGIVFKAVMPGRTYGTKLHIDSVNKIWAWIDKIGSIDRIIDVHHGGLRNKWLDKLTFLQTKSELLVQSMTMVSYLLHNTVVDKQGNRVMLWDAYKVNDKGLLVWDTDKMDEQVNSGQLTEIAEDGKSMNEEMMIQKIKAIIDNVHGDYQSALMAKRSVIGRVLMLFRTWLPATFEHRWGKERYDERLGRRVKGRYRSLGRISGKEDEDLGVGLMYAVRGLLYNKKGFEDMSDIDRVNMLRNIMELRFIIGMAALSLALRYVELGDDDDEEKMLINFLLNFSGRTQSDLMFFFNPGAMMRVTDNAVPALTTLLDAMMIAPLLVQTASGDARFKSGAWKGHLRLEKWVYKNIPVTSSAVRMHALAQQETKYLWGTR